MNSSKLRCVLYWGFVVLAGVILMLTPSAVYAAEFDDDGTITEGETIDDDVFLMGEDVVMDGTIRGSLFVMGNTVTINGKIDGDVFAGGSIIKVNQGAVISGNIFAGGQSIEIFAEVGGSVFAGGTLVRLGDGAVIERNVFAGAYDISLDEKSLVKRDLFAGGYQLFLAGIVNRDVKAASAAFDVLGQIGRNLEVEVASAGEGEFYSSPFFFYQSGIEIPKQRTPGLRIAESAEIKGDLKYTSPEDQQESILATPQGQMIYQTPVPEEQETQEEAAPKFPGLSVGIIFKWIAHVFRNLVTLLILGGLALWLVPNPLQTNAEKLRTIPWLSLGYGAACFFGGYLALIIVAITIFLVGLFFVIITLGGMTKILFGIGFSALALITALFLFLLWYGSKLIIAYLLGDLIMAGIAPNVSYRKVWALLIGIVIVVILISLPIIGKWLISPLIAIFGIGAFCLYLIALLKPAQIKANSAGEEPQNSDSQADVTE